MSPGEERKLSPPEGRPLRLCLDLNVFVADLLARRKGREDTAVRLLVESVAQTTTPLGRLQLIVSVGMLNRLRAVLEERLGVTAATVETYIGALAQYARCGPSGQSPLLVLGGTGVLPMPDREDAHVLETAIAGRADLLATADMTHFNFADTVVLEEGRVLRYCRADHDVVIAHPFRAARWIREGRIMLPKPPSQERRSGRNR